LVYVPTTDAAKVGKKFIEAWDGHKKMGIGDNSDRG